MKFLILFIYGISLFSQDVPNWILKTQDSKYFYGVGSAPKNNSFSRQLRIAKIYARANLSENISVSVESEFSKELNSTNCNVTFKSIQTSKYLLKFSKVLEKWKNSQGELFILLAVPKFNN